MLIFRNYLRSNRTVAFTFSVTKPKKQKTLYQILEVPSNATPTSIKKNYIKLAKLYHPDVYKGADKTRFHKIQQAYETLSNQSKRNAYDQSIGLRSTPSSDQPQSPTSDSNNQYGKPANDFKYAKPKVEINIDEEYEKFFNKKSTTQFEQIRLHQQPEFKAMSEKERIRRRFAEVYPDLNLDYKMKYRKSYSEILSDQINQKNRYEQEQRQKKEEFERKYSEEGMVRRQRYIKLGGVAAFLLMLPFILSLKTKLQLESKAKQSYEVKLNQMFKDVEQAQIRQRLHFK